MADPVSMFGIGSLVGLLLKGLTALFKAVFASHITPMLIMLGSMISATLFAKARLRDMYLEIQATLETPGAVDASGVASAVQAFADFMSGRPVWSWACDAFAVDRLAAVVAVVPLILTGWLALRITRFGIEMARDMRGLV